MPKYTNCLQDLDTIWEAEAANWAGAADAQPEPDPIAKQPSELSPEQLSLVYSLFNKVRLPILRSSYEVGACLKQ